MHPSELKSVGPTGSRYQVAEHGAHASPASRGDAAEFSQLMEDLVLSPSTARQPSAAANWMRAPVVAYDRLMDSLDRPAPAGMPVMQAMEFYARKQIDLNEAKTLQNVVATVAKLAKKSIETVLNNK